MLSSLGDPGTFLNTPVSDVPVMSLMSQMTTFTRFDDSDRFRRTPTLPVVSERIFEGPDMPGTLEFRALALLGGPKDSWEPDNRHFDIRDPICVETMVDFQE